MTSKNATPVIVAVPVSSRKRPGRYAVRHLWATGDHAIDRLHA